MLDRLDILWNFVGRPVPFDVETALRPAREVAVSVEKPGGVPVAPGAVRLFPGADLAAARLMAVRDGSGRRGFAADRALVAAEGGEYEGATVVWELGFDDRSPAGAGGRRLHFKVAFMGQQSYLSVTSPGGRPPLTVRMPNRLATDVGQNHWLTVTLRGALAGSPGRWRLEHDRAIWHTPREYLVVLEIRSEPAP
ncbi:MAG: hypothetical protein HY815_30965 [Candidatus Riflebacteria bacterium]|nr:hypothetical protein [Candidatus Riflebacteria bacterium]